MANTNTSATGGYLAPAAPAINDAAFDAILQGIVVGITGLDGTLVRPRWQLDDPKMPTRVKDPTTGILGDIPDWCAIGITEQDADIDPAISHVSPLNSVDDPTAYDQLQRHEVVSILASFYGPNSMGNAQILKDGFSVSQNREAMTAAGLGFVAVDRIVNAAELIGSMWVRRRDVPFRLRRIVIRQYPVLNIASAPGVIFTELPNTASGTNPDTSQTSFNAEANS